VSAAILDGKAIAQEIRGEVAQQAAEFAAANNGKKPCLATVLVGEDLASQVYIRMKHKACEKEGLDSRHHVLPDDATEEQLLKQIAELNADDSVNGILVQLPVPDQINEKKVLDAIDPLKDVDAFHPENVGRIVQGRPRFLPCTPYGIQQMLHRKGIEVSGKHVVVIGRSEIVGKPMAMMLMQRGSELGRESANGTVTVCHSRTADLPGVCRQADILIAAIGVAKFVTADMVKPGAAVIDVGINRTDDGLVGDVDFDAVKEVAGHITPVPGGVGPLTIAMLLHNTLIAARLQAG
jgi:methylenetetrahydrofolate dehydrogenase (NADP+)/methenyltetrahydrofolate cyclohydrolase